MTLVTSTARCELVRKACSPSSAAQALGAMPLKGSVMRCRAAPETPALLPGSAALGHRSCNVRAFCALEDDELNVTAAKTARDDTRMAEQTRAIRICLIGKTRLAKSSINQCPDRRLEEDALALRPIRGPGLRMQGRTAFHFLRLLRLAPV